MIKIEERGGGFIHKSCAFVLKARRELCGFPPPRAMLKDISPRFSWGKIWFEDFAPCKSIDISQLWFLPPRAMLKDISPRMPRPKTTNTPAAQVKRERDDQRVSFKGNFERGILGVNIFRFLEMLPLLQCRW